MNSPLVSIIIPVYNVEKYIQKCLESVVNQSYSNIEIIIIDDGSLDKSNLIYTEFALLDPRIQVHKKTNGGLSSARNLGIEKAVGKYIFFVDSDDYIDSLSVEKLVGISEENGLDMLRGRYTTCYDQSPKIYEEQKFIETKVQLGINYLNLNLKKNSYKPMAWLYFYKLEFLRNYKLKFKEGRLHEDEEFTLRALYYAKKVLDTNYNIYYYLIREESITTKKDKRKNIESLIKTTHELYSFFRKTTPKINLNQIYDYLARIQIRTVIMLRKSDFTWYRTQLDRRFILKNSRRLSTFLRALIVCISYRVYYHLYKYSRKIKISQLIILIK